MIDKSTFIARLSLMLTLFICLPTLADGVLGQNLVQNPGFDGGDNSWTIQLAKVVSSQAHEGKNSLQYQNINPKSYRMQTQIISAEPGQTIHFSAWVKGQDIIHNDRKYGASVFVQSYDEQGKYLGGSFPSGPTGTFDWTPINGLYIVPAGAEKVMIGVYLRRGATGTAWFDDVSAQIEKQPPFDVILEYPNYRGITTTDNNDIWKVLFMSNAADNQSAQIESRLISPSGKVLFTKNENLGSARTKVLSWKPTNNLPRGTYKWHFEMKAVDGKTIENKIVPIFVRSVMPSTYIDNQGFTVVNGQRYFPLGIYTGNSRDGKESYNTNIDLKNIANAGFNTILSYSYGDNENAARFLDDAEHNGLHVIYSLKDIQDDSQIDTYVQKFKDNPTLLAWYLNDESGPEHILTLEKMYQQVIKLDDAHPAYQTLYQVNLLNGYLNSLDIIGSDPYPVPQKPINEVSEWTRQTVAAANAAGQKGTWQVLQLYDSSLSNPKVPSHPPTLDEMRNMSYQALINGAKGLLYFAYHWLWAQDQSRQRNEAAFEKRWPDVQKLIGEIKPLTDVILKDNKVTLKVLSPSTAQYQAWQDDNKLYLVVVNAATEDKSESLQLQIPAGWHLLDNKIPGIQMQLKNNILQLDLAPLASGAVIFSR